MYKALVLLAVLAVAAFAEEAAPAADSKVIKLTDADFKEKTKEGIWMIKFFAPWCGHCKKVAPFWEEYAKLAEGIYNVAEVDCTVEKETATAMGIKGFPTLKFFENGVPTDISGPRTIQNWVEFVEQHATTKDVKGKITAPPPPPAEPPKEKKEPPKEKKDAPKAPETPKGPSDVVVLTAADFDEKTKTGIWFVKFYAPWCGHCKKLAPTWEELATLEKTENAFHVAEVDATVETALAQKFGVRGYPTLLLFVDGQEPARYNGARTIGDFTAFVKEQSAPKAAATEEKKAEL